MYIGIVAIVDPSEIKNEEDGVPSLDFRCGDRADTISINGVDYPFLQIKTAVELIDSTRETVALFADLDPVIPF